MENPHVVVMGVSASGKTVVGERLADLLGVPFTDADDLHSAANKAKMHAGIPLTDEDRMPWLAVVGATLSEATDGLVIACSALKRRYRDTIRADAPDAVFVELTGSRELLTERAEGRHGHFFPAELLDSQLDALESLESDERGVVVDVAPSVDEIARNAASALDDL